MKLPFKLSTEDKRDAIAYFKILSPAFFMVIVTFHFHEFVLHAIKSGFAINMGIITVSLYGIVLIMMRMRHAQVDFRVIERFGREVNRGAKMKDLMEEPWLKSVYVRHYLSHIANTGGTLHSQIDQNAIENELHALQSEYNNRLELPQFIAGFMVAMGLLGTFIGLLETLTGISGMLDGMGAPGVDVEKQFGELVTKLRDPLAGMGIAFSASMFGLITSLMLAIMMVNLRRYISRVIALARNVMHDLTVIASHNTSAQSNLPNRSDASLGSSINNTTIAGRFDLLTRKLEVVIEAIETSIGANQRMIDLMGFGPRMKELSERTLDEIKGMSVKMTDQQQLIKLLIDLSSESIKVERSISEIDQSVKETSEETLQAIKSLSSSDIFFSQRRDQEFRDRLISEIKALANVQIDQKKLSQSLIDIGGNNIRGIEAVVSTQRETKSELGSLVTRLIESMQKVEEVDMGSARHLYDIKERLTKIGNNFNVVDLIASGVSGQTVLLETLVEEARLSRVDENGLNQDGESFPPGYDPQNT
jgi:biopolymer transport protein ExbB/TolQ